MNYYLVKLTSKSSEDVKKMCEILLKSKLGTYLSVNNDKVIVDYDFDKKSIIKKVRCEVEFYTREDLIPLFIGLLKESNIPTEEFVEIELDKTSILFEKMLKESLKEPKTFGFELKKKTFDEKIDLDTIPKDNYSVQKLHDEYYKKEG